jgi:hypothetical protein
MDKLDNLKKANGFDKNSQNINRNGRPKGSRNKKMYLKLLIKDIIHLYKGEINPYTKRIMYDIYSISLSDYSNNIINDTISHLYFIESDFGIKIGISKNVNRRLVEIKNYAPSSRIIKSIKYAGNYEKLLHHKFKKQNIKNNPLFGIEWFYKNDDLYSFIQETNTILDLANEFNHSIPKQLQLF